MSMFERVCAIVGCYTIGLGLIAGVVWSACTAVDIVGEFRAALRAIAKRRKK